MMLVARRESSLNPYAIAIVGGRLKYQPRNLSEAVATAAELLRRGINFSAGLNQVNVQHFRRFGLTAVSVFDVCENLRAGSTILSDCFELAEVKKRGAGEQITLRFALSCYYSGNFKTGFDHKYVQKIDLDAARLRGGQITLAR